MINEKVLVKLDLGCGQRKQPGYIGVDISNCEGVDIIHDLETFPWPFESESVDDIFCSHYIEHTSDMIKFMDECYRILVPNGKMNITAPYYSSMRCWQDPTHKRAISEASFLYYNYEWRKSNFLNHYPIKSDFDFTYGYGISPEWSSRSPEAQAFAIKHYINVVNDIYVTLVKKEIKVV